MPAQKIFLCCLNIQEGRSSPLLSLLTNACSQTLLKVFSDPVYNRSNFTLYGNQDEIVRTVSSLTDIALEHININTSHGDTSHHHIGALDLIPVHPFYNTTLIEAGFVAREIAKCLNSLDVPTLLYGHAHPDLLSLVSVRKITKFYSRGQNVATHDARVKSVSTQPDLEMHPTVGISVVGATNYVQSYNLVLNTTNLSITNSIVRDIRSKNVEAMGYLNKYENSAVTEVACNLTDTSGEGGSCEEVQCKVESLAAERGLRVVHSYTTNPSLEEIGRILNERGVLEF